MPSDTPVTRPGMAFEGREYANYMFLERYFPDYACVNVDVKCEERKICSIIKILHVNNIMGEKVAKPDKPIAIWQRSC